MELLTNVDPTWNIDSKCCQHLSTAYLVMWKLPETFSVTVDVVVNSSAWRYTFHGKWQKKRLLCERLEGEVSKWVSKIGGFQKEASHLMILVSPTFSRSSEETIKWVWVLVYFCYIFGARSWSLELRSWPELCTWDGISAMVPDRLQSCSRFPVLEMFYWRRIVFDEAFGPCHGAANVWEQIIWIDAFILFLWLWRYYIYIYTYVFFF